MQSYTEEFASGSPCAREVRQTVNSMPPGPLFVADGFLTEDECLACAWAMDAGKAEEAEVLGAGSEARLDLRRAQHIEVAPAVLALVEERLDQFRDSVATYFGLHLTAREGSGFVRYPEGGFYAPHVDWSDSLGWPDAARRQVALVVFLASSTAADPAGPFDGGILRLFPDGGPDEVVEVAPRRGTLLAFPATLLHEVTVVQRGERDAIVDWYY